MKAPTQLYRDSLSQWLNFKLFGITYLVGKISRSNGFLFQGPGRLSEPSFIRCKLKHKSTSPPPLLKLQEIHPLRFFDLQKTFVGQREANTHPFVQISEKIEDSELKLHGCGEKYEEAKALNAFQRPDDGAKCQWYFQGRPLITKHFRYLKWRNPEPYSRLFWGCVFPYIGLTYCLYR